jgi:hypothetical protein
MGGPGHGGGGSAGHRGGGSAGHEGHGGGGSTCHGSHGGGGQGSHGGWGGGARSNALNPQNLRITPHLLQPWLGGPSRACIHERRRVIRN